MLEPATFAAVYFVTWWICLFLVLPFGVRNQIETGSYIQGTERGAPAASPMWWRRVLWTTLLAIPVSLLLLWGASNPVLQRYWNGA